MKKIIITLLKLTENIISLIISKKNKNKIRRNTVIQVILNL